MPVFEQGYRRYEGTLSRRSPVLPMVWQNFRPRMRWYIWVLLAVMLFWPYVVYGAMVFLITMGNTLFGLDTPPARGVGTAATVAYATLDPMNPGAVMGGILDGSRDLFWQVMNHASLANIVIPAVACGGILSSDRTTGATQIYFARPVTRFDYLASKVLTVCAFSALVTMIPTLLLWFECVAFSRDPQYILRTWTAFPAILGASALYAVWTASVVLALSATLRRPVLAAVGTIFVYLLLSAMGPSIAAAAADQRWLVLSPFFALGGMTAPLFGMELPDWLATPWLLVPGLVVPLALLSFVWWRVRAVEVVT